MAAVNRSSQEGFDGELAGLGLSDVLQLHAQNRSSGRITVEHQGQQGEIFLRDGEIVHAELGDTVGEMAFCEILAWPSGRFAFQPKLATTRATIQKPWQHLILDAYRVIDERRAGRGERTPAPPQAQPAAQARAAGVAVVDRVRAIEGVTYAVVQAKDGTRDDASYEAEHLAGQAIFLGLVANELGAILQVGEPVQAAVHGTDQHLLLLAERSHVLGVSVKGEARLGPVEAEVRRVLDEAR
jgi:hypothetical protein